VQLAQPLERVRRSEQRAVAVLAHPLVQVLRAGAQVDDRAARGKAAAIFLREHRAAAGGKHDALERRQLGERLRLAGTEAGLALDVEDRGYLDAAAALELQVAINEAQLQPPREQAPDGGLASAHHADEEQVAAPIHAAL